MVIIELTPQSNIEIAELLSSKELDKRKAGSIYLIEYILAFREQVYEETVELLKLGFTESNVKIRQNILDGALQTLHHILNRCANISLIDHLWSHHIKYGLLLIRILNDNLVDAPEPLLTSFIFFDHVHGQELLHDNDSMVGTQYSFLSTLISNHKDYHRIVAQLKQAIDDKNEFL